MSIPETGYLIHKAGRGWYRPEAEGYTLNSDEAGRFSLSDANAHSYPNGLSGPRDGITYTHESKVGAGSSCEKDLRIFDLIAERNALRESQEQLSQDLAEATAQIEKLKAQLRGALAAADTIAHLSK